MNANNTEQPKGSRFKLVFEKTEDGTWTIGFVGPRGFELHLNAPPGSVSVLFGVSLTALLVKLLSH